MIEHIYNRSHNTILIYQYMIICLYIIISLSQSSIQVNLIRIRSVRDQQKLLYSIYSCSYNDTLQIILINFNRFNEKIISGTVKYKKIIIYLHYNIKEKKKK